MKKLLAITLVGAMLVTNLTACGKSESKTIKIGDTEITTESTSNSSDNTQEAKADTVDVTYPKQAYSNYSEEQIKSTAKLMGDETTVKINDDGSVTYTMTKEEQTKQLEDTKTGLLEGCKKLVDSKQKSYLKDISFDDNLENVTIKVVKADYEKDEKVSFKEIERNCLGYQVLNEVKLADLKVTAHLIDDATGEEFATETFNADNIN